MITVRVAWVLLLSACLSACLGPAPQPVANQAPLAPEEYRLGIGDIISVRVYGGDEDLTFPRIRINDRGKLTFPFGEFTAYNQTTRELETAMAAALKGQYLLKPRVWVNIEEYRPFFMQGQVARPGAYPYQPGLSVLRAVTIAGGFRERASQQRIFLVKESDTSNKPVRVDMNSAVRPGDTIIVEESFF